MNDELQRIEGWTEAIVAFIEARSPGYAETVVGADPVRIDALASAVERVTGRAPALPPIHVDFLRRFGRSMGQGFRLRGLLTDVESLIAFYEAEADELLARDFVAFAVPDAPEREGDNLCLHHGGEVDYDRRVSFCALERDSEHDLTYQSFIDMLLLHAHFTFAYARFPLQITFDPVDAMSVRGHYPAMAEVETLARHLDLHPVGPTSANVRLYDHERMSWRAVNTIRPMRDGSRPPMLSISARDMQLAELVADQVEYATGMSHAIAPLGPS